MATRRSYVIVTICGQRKLRHHRRGVGQHRLIEGPHRLVRSDQPQVTSKRLVNTGLSRRSHSSRPSSRPPHLLLVRRLQRGQHRRVTQSPVLAVRYAVLLILASTIGTSAWFAVTGAAAMAQMLHP